jgi:hypothetical protein
MWVIEMSISYIEEQTKVTKEFNIEPELYIYLQKLAKDRNIDINEVLNNIIREKALDEFKVTTNIIGNPWKLTPEQMPQDPIWRYTGPYTNEGFPYFTNIYK